MSNRLTFDAESRTFILSDGKQPRVVFGDLCLNFRTVRHRLVAGRIMPEPGRAGGDGRERFVCRLRGMGSRKTIGLGQAAVAVTTEEVGGSLLIGLENTMGEVCFSPDEAVSLTLTDLPGVRRSVFFHNRSNEFQNFDCEGLWWSQSVFSQNPCRDLNHEWGLLAFWHYEDGTVGGILPVSNGEVIGRLRGDEHGLSTITADFRGGSLIEQYPLALLAFGESVAKVRDQLFESAAAMTPGMSLREPDTLPPAPLDRLGWCSWNAFGKEVCEEDIRSVASAFRESKLPVHFMLLDDGWLHFEPADSGGGLAEGITNHALISMDPYPESFPGGMARLIAHVKSCGIEAFGLWHTLNGYWGGIHPESEPARTHPEEVCVTRHGEGFPNPEGKFFKRWYARMNSWGVDFVKVDNQGFHRRILPYERSLPAYAQALHRNQQESACEAGFPVIHCMATHSELLFQARPGNLLRISNDFAPNDDFSARLHIVNNFHNALWASRLFCPDFDMFQTADRHAMAFAHMLALSHSPIYLTDRPENLLPERVHQLVGADGCIPRYEHAAVPLDFFGDPFDGEEVFAVVARHGAAASVGLFNVLRRGEAAARAVRPEDVDLHERCLVWSQAGTFSPRVVEPGQAVRVNLKALKSDILHFCPLREGFAPMGLTDYLAAPATLRELRYEEGKWHIDLTGTGLFTAWSEQPPTRILADGEPLRESSEAALPPGSFHWHGGLLTVHSPGTELCLEFPMH
ncbi:MAG: Sip1-related alpha-galactosidase [Kiritimatiellia bacterium]